jgi:hypothetical protein
MLLVTVALIAVQWRMVRRLRGTWGG